MGKMVTRLKPGDVFRTSNERIANGQRHSDDGCISVGYSYYPYVVQESGVCNHCGSNTGEYIETDKYDAYKKARIGALFVVEVAEMTGGGEVHHRDYYPDGLYIRARRLRRDGTYSPSGELISFYMSGDFNCMIEEVELVDHFSKCYKK